MNAPRRGIRSFVLRAGRITPAQKRALEELMPRYGIPFAGQPLDLDAAFGRRAPRILEIGFGNGDTLVELAARSPEIDFIGAEVHPPGVGHCLLAIDAARLTNVRVVMHDAVEVLKDGLAPASLDEVLLYFPDPWPKKRHHKRRIVQPEFAALIAAKLEPGGLFHVATDWAPYAEHIADVLAGRPAFEAHQPATPGRAETRFERRGRRLGHEVFEQVWRRSTGQKS